MPISSGRSVRGVAAEPALIMARADSEAMPRHLEEIARAVAEGPHALVILDQAGWHTSAKPKVPANITLVPLLPTSRERKAPETIWQYLRQTYLSNRVFAHYAAILDACQDAWRKLLQETGRTASIATRQWAIIGQSQ